MHEEAGATRSIIAILIYKRQHVNNQGSTGENVFPGMLSKVQFQE